MLTTVDAYVASFVARSAGVVELVASAATCRSCPRCRYLPVSHCGRWQGAVQLLEAVDDAVLSALES